MLTARLLMIRGPSMFSLSATNFIFQFFTVGLYIFLLQFLRYKGFSLTQIGLLMAISPTISIISQPFWGISEKYQTIKKILVLLITFALIFVTELFFVESIAGITILLVALNFFVNTHSFFFRKSGDRLCYAP